VSDEVAFLGLLLLTVALLIAVAITGKRAQLRAHITLVCCAVAGLASAIYFALQVGQHYDLEAAGPIPPIHMAMARIATAAYLLPVITGVMTLRRPRYKRLHGKVALLVIALTVLATVTGAIMLSMALPIGAE